MIGISLDVTRRKHAEELFETQSTSAMNLSKMSALGEMAGGVAHEINNPLTILRTSAALIKNELTKSKPSSSKLMALVDDIDSTTQRIAKIVEGLSFFARDGSRDEFERAFVSDIISDTLSFCKERFRKHGIDLQVSPIPNNLSIKCRPVQISQVILNLLNNARDAVEESSLRTVRVECHTLGKKIQISVLDSGQGIEPQYQNKIFRPFFTTKGAGKGTGLGLSIAKGIIESHSGSIEVSRHKNMTRFDVFLPLVADFIHA